MDSVNVAPMAKAHKNTIGEQLRKIRTELKLSQAGLAILCQTRGWSITRETIARIEGCARCVTDFELLLLAESLDVQVSVLLPPPRLWHSRRKMFLQGYEPSA